MSDLLREVAALPQICGGLSVRLLGDQGQGGFWLTRTDAGPEVLVAVIAGDYARMLSNAPAMLDLLASALVHWDKAVEQDEPIDGGDAVDWVTAFTAEAGVVAGIGLVASEPWPG